MLEINGLVKKYKDFILNCTMKVERGCITGLVGENGAGKSTTFKAALGLISYDSGDITLMGKEPSELKEEDKSRIGVTLAESGFSGYLKVKDIIPVMSAMYPEFDRSRFESLCRKFGVPQDKYIKEFSTGMKAKLKVLVAVTHGADFLLLDEPTTGLDVMAREGILNLLREYMEEDENRSILISSHISTDLEGLCDDLYLIHEGQIILHEEMDTLLNEYGLIKADDVQYGKLDKEHILSVRRTSYGYDCLTDQRQYYRENYPDIVVENGSLDEVITMMTGGKRL
ncbi:ABC transporter ATP-binding protein [Mediterraneibacter glycyrrhizinilyticus]|uniref:ABC transporter ATP-binding protein n=1 Tax=Mediterraneibacter glycyrrhizinilyticus TaxID=342942 RepID=UPI002659EE71|nr:ABC transporter ATP-binding protein [Mediterraneibacter glycyrrhizinilyticus]MCF2567808.1 ABC transporter ATP-binding protein [Mediterraneibacter glycyrrhizinilyticus]